MFKNYIVGVYEEGNYRLVLCVLVWVQKKKIGLIKLYLKYLLNLKNW